MLVTGKLKSIKERDFSQGIKEVTRDSEKGELEERLERVLKISLGGLVQRRLLNVRGQIYTPISKLNSKLGKVDNI